ncbi:MAG TPA: serine/threonine-protein kinase [Polyangiaceae bacterium]
MSRLASKLDAVPAARYRTLFELGQGGTSNVYLAVAVGPAGFNKLVVLKELRSAYAQDPEFRAMFENEARLSARLNHPNIVQVNEVAEHEGSPTIVMEYLEGQTLEAIISNCPEPLSWPMHLRIIADVLRGLHHCHELCDYQAKPLNVVHRDVSPHNVMITYDGVVKVLDFGIAKLSGSLIETETGVIKGKLRYMPPEQIRGGAIDRRADVYAAGVMLWEAATGLRMWKGLSDATIRDRVLAGEIPTPSSLRNGVPEGLEALVMKALAPTPEQRFSTALELETRIDELLSDMSVRVSPRDIGRFVATCFARTRTSIQGKIQAAFGDDDTKTMELVLVAGATTLTAPGFASNASEEPARRGARARVQRVAAFAVALAAFVWLVSHRQERATTAAPSRAAVVSTAMPSASPPALPKPVTVRVTAFPADAALSLDGTALTSNPFHGEFPRDARDHLVRVSAAGYEPAVATAHFDDDVELVLVLKKQLAPRNVEPGSAEPRAAAKRAVNPASPASPARAASPASAASLTSAANCTPPYTIDARGIKKFKSECL